MTFCTLITWLAVAIVILSILPGLLNWLLSGNLIEFFQKYCDRLCKLWVVLAFLFGLLLGAILCCCYHEYLGWLEDNTCRLLVLLGLLLLIYLLYRYLLWVAACGLGGITAIKLGRVSLSLYWLIVILALLIWWLIRRCCGDEDESGDAGWTLCHTLFLSAILLFLVLAIIRFITTRACDRGSYNCEGISTRLWLVLLVEILVLFLVYRCCDALIADKYELAMVGIWWQGKSEGEAGAHLRWQFDIEVLHFPENGFDLQRRPSSGGSWATLNGAHIEPATTWGDETSVTGDMWIGEGVERLHADSWDQFRDVSPDDQPFTDLVEMVALSTNPVLYYVEPPDPATFATAPSNPYLTEADRQAYVDSYYAAVSDGALPLLTWDAEPMSLIMTTALHPEIARLVGLYYIDKTADPNTEYDYRVVGYWLDRERTYVVEGISAPTTKGLDPPVILTASSPAEVGVLSGNPIFDDLAVELLWSPPDYDPNSNIGLIDKIDSVLFDVEHQSIEVSTETIPDCVSATPGTTWNSATRPDENGDPAPIAKVLPAPVENTTTGLYEWPDVFLRHRVDEYGCHAYRIQGQDVFGRLSPHSGARVVAVVDTTPPPPPSAVAARVYQVQDDSLTVAERDRFFPAGSTNTFAMHVSWVWTEEAAERAPDLNLLRISLHHTDLGTLLASDWSDATQWDLPQIGNDVSASVTASMPAHLASVGYDAADGYFEVVLDDDDLGSLAAVGLDADDFTPVEYAYVGVSAVDHAPYLNQGPVAPPVTAFTRDLTPPDPPDAPFLSAGPFAAAADGNRSLEMTWNGVSHYTYALYRVDARDVDVLGDVADLDPTTLPAECFPDGIPVRPVDLSDEDWLDVSTRFLLEAAAHAESEAFARVSPLPLESDGATASFIDAADGTISRLYVYAATATDLAGNESTMSCPSDAILVEDGIAPRAPVVRQVVGADNAIQITWNANPEEDLLQYVVYRTANKTFSNSRRRMLVVARIAPDGNDLTGDPAAPVATKAGTAPYDHLTLLDTGVTPGIEFYYRVEAVDLTGNRSSLSEITSGRAFDQQPPSMPEWTDPALTVNGNGDTVLTWQAAIDDSGLTYQVQRQSDGSPMWRSIGGWSEPDVAMYTDSTVREPGQTYRYRIRAMDAAGNRSDWSEEREITLP